MRAGALFSSNEPPPCSATIASGLLALTQLDHADLAVALLVDLWSGDNPKVANETAVLVIDAALRSTTKPNAQLVAAELLCRQAKRLDACQSLHWPSAIDGGWDSQFGPKTKVLLLDALVSMTLSGPAKPDSLRSVAVRLYGAWNGEEDERVRGCIGMIISAVVPSLRRLGYSDFIQGSQRVMLADLEVAERGASLNPDGYLGCIVKTIHAQLSEWAATCPALDESCKLASAVT